mmetsp:Transcript_62064/g.140385  ORF Transcript_62064/g.140385 Transcript_62064/m.140385 type:complete len:496 (+) Transcript_62064:115-1602(+)
MYRPTGTLNNQIADDRVRKSPADEVEHAQNSPSFSTAKRQRLGSRKMTRRNDTISTIFAEMLCLDDDVTERPSGLPVEASQGHTSSGSTSVSSFAEIAAAAEASPRSWTPPGLGNGAFSPEWQYREVRTPVGLQSPDSRRQPRSIQEQPASDLLLEDAFQIPENEHMPAHEILERRPSIQSDGGLFSEDLFRAAEKKQEPGYVDKETAANDFTSRNTSPDTKTEEDQLIPEVSAAGAAGEEEGDFYRRQRDLRYQGASPSKRVFRRGARNFIIRYLQFVLGALIKVISRLVSLAAQAAAIIALAAFFWPSIWSSLGTQIWGRLCSHLAPLKFDSLLTELCRGLYGLESGPIGEVLLSAYMKTVGAGLGLMREAKEEFLNAAGGEGETEELAAESPEVKTLKAAGLASRQFQSVVADSFSQLVADHGWPKLLACAAVYFAFAPKLVSNVLGSRGPPLRRLGQRRGSGLLGLKGVFYSVLALWAAGSFAAFLRDVLS